MEALTWRGLEFTNPLGLAGGVDKNGDHIQHWWTLGPGFIEVGTITPKAQEANVGKILDRDIKSESLWNHMGFPNKGASHVLGRIKDLYQPHFTPIFVNIGKNRGTSLESAGEDYIYCMKQMFHYADAFVINISSPNTSDLRNLLKPENLSKFLKPIVEARKELSAYETRADGEGTSGGESQEGLEQGVVPAIVLKPLLLKVSPDVSEEELSGILQTSLDVGIDGWILTNTTSSRREGSSFPKEGGVSGGELAFQSKTCLKQAVHFLGEQKKGKLLISVGGVMTSEEVLERLDWGADLVQVYSALTFCGPFFFRQVAEYVDLKA